MLVSFLEITRALDVTYKLKLLFIWLSLMMSVVVTTFVLNFPIGCFGWDLGLNCVSS